MTNTSELVTEYLDLKDRAAQLDARIKQIVSELRTLGEGTHEAGDHKVRVTQAVRFDPELATATLPPELITACSETVLSASKAKKILPPALYTACSKPYGDPRVNVSGVNP